jgi:threonine dehydratase
MTPIFPGITSTIGRTPIVRVNRIAPSSAQLFVKLEAFNPGGSVKDRMALAIIEEAERQGRLKPGQTVVELQHRAAQAHAVLRRQGGHHAGLGARQRYARQG